MVDEKTCKKCGKTLPKTGDFWVTHKGSVIGARCRACYNHDANERARARFKVDQKFRERKRVKYSEKRRILTERWRKANSERWIEICKKSELKRDKDKKAVNRINTATRRSKRFAAWADLEKIAELHAECRRLSLGSGKRYEVDHVIPLNGRLVCGLHVEYNLQIVLAEDNRRKSNKFIC